MQPLLVRHNPCGNSRPADNFSLALQNQEVWRAVRQSSFSPGLVSEASLLCPGVQAAHLQGPGSQEHRAGSSGAAVPPRAPRLHALTLSGGLAPLRGTSEAGTLRKA